MSADLAVVGAGAIGLFLAGVAQRAGHRVTLIVRRPAQRDAVNREGIALRMPGEAWHGRPVAMLADEIPEDRQFDGVLLAVKVGATEAALSPVLPHVRPDAPVLCCQNGLNDEAVARLAGTSRVVAVVLALPVVLEGETGSRCLVDNPRIDLGAFQPAEQALADRAAGFFGPPLIVRTSPDIAAARWSKLALNCSTGPLLALTGMTLGELTGRPEAAPVMLAVIREVMATAVRDGVTPAPLYGLSAADWLDGPEPVALEAIRNSGNANPDARSSMWADLSAGRRTEIEALNGAVMKRAIRLGSSAPVNAALCALVTRAENGDRPDSAALWDCLARAARQEEDEG